MCNCIRRTAPAYTRLSTRASMNSNRYASTRDNSERRAAASSRCACVVDVLDRSPTLSNQRPTKQQRTRHPCKCARRVAAAPSPASNQARASLLLLLPRHFGGATAERRSQRLPSYICQGGIPELVSTLVDYALGRIFFPFFSSQSACADILHLHNWRKAIPPHSLHRDDVASDWSSPIECELAFAVGCCHLISCLTFSDCRWSRQLPSVDVHGSDQ